nr:putative ABC transporter permease [Paenibacillus sp. FSL H7-0357]
MFCPIYGFGVLLILYVAKGTEARIEDPFIRMMALICVSALLVTWLEYVTGLILDKVLQRKWWDYSGNQWNLGGYVCGILIAVGIYCMSTDGIPASRCIADARFGSGANDYDSGVVCTGVFHI